MPAVHVGSVLSLGEKKEYDSFEQWGTGCSKSQDCVESNRKIYWLMMRDL